MVAALRNLCCELCYEMAINNSRKQELPYAETGKKVHYPHQLAPVLVRLGGFYLYTI